MYSPPPPATAPALRHPDDPSSYVSGASQAPASMIAANPWLTPVRTSPMQPASSSTRPQASPAASSDVSRSSAFAEPPTEQSRVRALQQVTPQDDLRFGGGFGNAFGDMQETTLQMPKLAMSSPRNERNDALRNGADRAAGVPRWNESEFDRLIREKLEGPHSARTQFKRTVTERAQGHLSWQWQTLDAVIDGTLAMWEGVRSTGGRLLGMVPNLPDSANCRRMNQAKPIVINLGEEDELPQDPGDDFRDLISAPAATREPIPARIPRAEIPPFTPAGREGLTIMEGSESEPAQAAQEKKAKPRDAASALSVSSKMTSSAAALLGGFTKTTPAAASSDDPPLTEKKVVRPGDSKSCIAPTSAMNSSAASSLGALFAKQSNEDAGMGTIKEDEEPSAQEQPKVAPKASGKAKSVVVGSTAFSSSAAGALGALTAKSRPESPPAEDTSAPSAPSEPSREAPAPKKSAAAKSVLNQSTVMSSSAAGALSGLLAPKVASAKSAPADAAPEGDAAAAAETPQPKRSTAAKSVLNQSNVMSSSAAGALGGLLAKSKPPGPAPAETPSQTPAETPSEVPKAKGRPADRQSALAASTVMTSSAAATLGALAAPKAAPKAVSKGSSGGSEAPTAPAPAVAKVKSKPKAGQSVISGLNTSSSASALLGPMMQAKK